jgi:hypothetical protein
LIGTQLEVKTKAPSGVVFRVAGLKDSQSNAINGDLEGKYTDFKRGLALTQVSPSFGRVWREMGREERTRFRGEREKARDFWCRTRMVGWELEWTDDLCQEGTRDGRGGRVEGRERGMCLARGRGMVLFAWQKLNDTTLPLQELLLTLLLWSASIQL